MKRDLATYLQDDPDLAAVALFDADSAWERLRVLTATTPIRRGVSALASASNDYVEHIPPRDYQRIADEVSLALETIALTGRRV